MGGTFESLEYIKGFPHTSHSSGLPPNQTNHTTTHTSQFPTWHLQHCGLHATLSSAAHPEPPPQKPKILIRPHDHHPSPLLPTVQQHTRKAVWPHPPPRHPTSPKITQLYNATTRHQHPHRPQSTKMVPQHPRTASPAPNSHLANQAVQ